MKWIEEHDSVVEDDKQMDKIKYSAFTLTCYFQHSHSFWKGKENKKANQVIKGVRTLAVQIGSASLGLVFFVAVRNLRLVVLTREVGRILGAPLSHLYQ